MICRLPFGLLRRRHDEQVLRHNAAPQRNDFGHSSYRKLPAVRGWRASWEAGQQLAILTDSGASMKRFWGYAGDINGGTSHEAVMKRHGDGAGSGLRTPVCAGGGPRDASSAWPWRFIVGPRPTVCQDSARIAVARGQENLHRHCGYVGPRWQSNMDAHLAWCRSISNKDFSELAAEQRARSDMLDASLPQLQGAIWGINATNAGVALIFSLARAHSGPTALRAGWCIDWCGPSRAVFVETLLSGGFLAASDGVSPCPDDTCGAWYC